MPYINGMDTNKTLRSEYVANILMQATPRQVSGYKIAMPRSVVRRGFRAYITALIRALLG